METEGRGEREKGGGERGGQRETERGARGGGGRGEERERMSK